MIILEPVYRGRGLGLLALQLMLSYATSPHSSPPLPISPTALVCRIGESNARSRQLFEKLGFVMTKKVDVFQEIELRFRGMPDHWVAGSVRPYVHSEYK